MYGARAGLGPAWGAGWGGLCTCWLGIAANGMGGCMCTGWLVIGIGGRGYELKPAEACCVGAMYMMGEGPVREQ